MDQQVKLFMSSTTNAIEESHRSGAEGFATCAKLTAMTDKAVSMAFHDLSSSQHIAVLALGGFGRGELCPKSDVDLMVLCDEQNKSAAAQKAKRFLQSLWDAGLDVGHSVRTIREALAQHDTAVDSWASMLESRFLCGDESLASEFFDRMGQVVGKGKDRWFIEGVFDEVRSRHERFGNSIKLLEPNIKKSAGTLRDFQSLFWLFRANESDFYFRIDAARPASLQFLDRLVEKNVLDDDERSAVRNALNFLFRARHEMHFRRHSSSDSLEYALQREVAEGLGFGGTAELRSVEVFMHEYYLHARTIHRLFQNLSHRFREIVEPLGFTFRRAEKYTLLYHRSEDQVTAEPTLLRLTDAQQVFEAFVLSAEHDIDLHPRLRGILANSLDLVDDRQRQSPELAGMFRRILNSRRVAETLHDMNELGVLGAYIPEWNDLVAFFQHNMYHYFTADEHTLIAIASIERLREQQSIMREVFRSLRRKDLLYMTLLLHDIGKPRGVADHEITGVAIARDVLERVGMADVFPDVAFLIRNHLIMEQIAFRRNIHDPATIWEFASRFERPELLDYLYLHTYADLSAVNKNVWTEWKSTLLLELYQLTAEVLRRNLKGVQIDEFKQARYEKASEALVERLSEALPREHVEQHLDGIGSDAYIALFSDDEIEEHIHKSKAEETVSTMVSQQEGYSEITVITEDAPFALSKFCAVMAANDANIFDANIFTRDDGIIIDRFRVTDAATKNALTQNVCAKITNDLNAVMEGKLDCEHLFEAHRRKWKRRQRPPANPSTRTDVEFEDHPRYTIIDVYAPDSLGFLYRITESISKLGLNIYFAKIATRVDGIVDAFYVLHRSGAKVVDPAQQAVVREEILATINAISQQELASLAD